MLPRIGQSRVWFFTISKLNWLVFDRTSRDLNIIKRDRVVGELLVSFVTFSGDENDIARLGETDRAIDRFGAIDNFLVTVGTKSFFNLCDNFFRIFLARIV